VPELLTFLKPDAILRVNVGATIVRELSEHPDLELLSFEQRQIDADLAREHYAHVADRPFYPWLERYVTATPVYIMLAEVADDEAVERLRAALGNTISHQAEPGTIRGRLGIYAGVNCLHLSDSVASGEVETGLWVERLGIEAGSFDTPLEAYAERFDPAIPNRTASLREICTHLAEIGRADEANLAQVRTLLEGECPGASAEQLERLVEIVTGSGLN
jgi:nucleoside-diphosphate kinase